ncbi:GNAT family N-acetyltransferase [Labedaea rhizosphaerae]|uniref:Acetyltransferase (GNAT) family protein n=1 Tax=Labedaea rhizosphaerae TaxID=598644 RepID=A0A4R6S708_LABRH|nr:GNAT family N-acetyltransferase [Labedaea rhizosphaerae]TDP95153.1 acetyltransferase (GNAT) family protein [Labedaea rhizosphaerae]
MTGVIETPGVDQLSEVVHVMREWQHDGAPAQLHPGDVGWFCRFGVPAAAAALRVWRRAGRILAVGLLDEPDLLRLTIAPDALGDEDLAREVADGAADVLVGAKVAVSAPEEAVLQDVLAAAGWKVDEPWVPLRRELTEPVKDPGIRVEVVGPAQVPDRVAVQRASFSGSTFTEEAWHAMASGVAYADARCLVAYDEQGNAVATVTVWSAGPDKPGLLEPMGVHQDHRGHGYGTAISVAAAAALRDLGAATAIVCTPRSNAAAVATYKAAGFVELPEILDRVRA